MLNALDVPMLPNVEKRVHRNVIAAQKKLNNNFLKYKQKIKSHIVYGVRLDFFIEDYLIYRELEDVIQGITSIGMFFTYFYTRKCMWSTPANIKTTAASIKRFYKYLYEVNVIQKDDYQLLCNIIKTDMESWQYECAVLNGDIKDESYEELPFY